MPTAAINLATTANTLLVAAPTDAYQIIRVKLVTASSASAVTLTFTDSGGTILPGTCPFRITSSQWGLSCAQNDQFFDVPAGQGLYFKLGSGVQTDGMIVYAIVG